MQLLRVVLFLTTTTSLLAGDLDTVGVTLLRQADPTLQGGGVRIAQPEGATANDFEVNPAAVGQPSSLFTYINNIGNTATNFPNSVGTESGHADNVANSLYGLTTGVAPQVNHVDNYDADYFVNHFLSGGIAIAARISNQSFAYPTNLQSGVDSTFDDYAAVNDTIFVSAVGNGGPIFPPGTCYNGIGVAIYTSPSSVGPTPDGRCKPDLTAPDLKDAPNGANSYSTPYVAGAAAVLVQAANRGDGGANTNAANDLRTIKALLLNGAVKPTGWTNSPTAPLDARYGAGLVNVFNSWTQLKGGLHPSIETTSANGTNHPPGLNVTNEPVLVGWDNAVLTDSGTQDRINHYYFNLTGTNSFAFTATLAWNRQENRTAINDLNLFLYKTSNSNLVASSVSTVDNVEHLFLSALAPGRYDLQVLKKRAGRITASETYALAFEMFGLKLNIALTNNNAVISWPLAPTGFRLQSTTSLTPPVAWTSVNATVSVNTNTGQNIVTLPVGVANQFFRLLRPTADFGL